MFERRRMFLGLLLLWMSQSALPQTLSGALAVTATVGPSGCVMTSVPPLSFSDYFPLHACPAHAVSQIVVTCTAGVPYDLGVDSGEGSGKTANHRSMTKTTSKSKDPLSYRLFWSSNHTTHCGEYIGRDTRHLLGTGLPQTTTVYGEIPVQQSVEAGAYSDRVTISVTF